MSNLNFDVVALTQALVRCPSITPADEGALQISEDHLKSMGFICNRLPFVEKDTQKIDNLFATIGTAGKHIAFAGHTDVVPPGLETSWDYPPFSATIANEKLFGRGVEDMKGGICMFY